MNSSRILFSLFCALPFYTGPAFASDPTVAGEPTASDSVSARTTGGVAADRLWIAVHVPKATKPVWVGDDLTERFADRVAAELRTQGFPGKLGTLRPEDFAPSQASVLVIRLAEWRATGNAAVCTFTASLRTRYGDRDLGQFTGDNKITTSAGDIQLSSDGLVGSAQEALNNFASRLKATGLL